MSTTNLDPIINLAQTGQIEAACQACDTALESGPNNPELLHLRGLLFSLSNKSDEAILFINRAIHVRPQPKYWSNLGNALTASGRLDEAERAYRHAIELDATFGVAWFNLGKLLLNRGRAPEAAEALEYASRLESTDGETWKALGDTYHQLGKFIQARQAYEQGFASTGRDPEFAALIAYCLERENRLDDARRMAEITLASQPGHGLANLVMAILDRRAGRAEAAHARLLAMSDTGMSLPLRVQHEHELGVLEDRAHAYDSAYAHFAQAKTLQASLPTFVRANRERYLTRLGQLIELDYSWLAQRRNPAKDGIIDPVFIVGFPRSGTTLLNQFLHGHPQLHVMEETPLLSVLEQLLSDMQITNPSGLATLPDAQANALRRQYFDLARTAHPGWDGKKRLVDKFPLNISRLPLAASLFPEAQILLSLRHPYDACLSGFMQLFSPNDAMASFADLKSGAMMYDRVFTLWEKVRESLPIPWLSVKYENLIVDPEGQMRAVIQFLGLPWTAALLDHTSTIGERGHINTPSYHQVARPLHRESLGRWVSYAHYFKPLEPLLLRHAKAWDYDTEPTR
jgi:Flp pilus assembly protein TadD